MVGFRRMVKFPKAIAIGLLLRRSIRLSDLVSASPHLRTFSVSSNDYLVSSLSLSPDSVHALKCKPYSIKSTANADSVIALFTVYGFSKTHLAKLFSLYPKLLAFHPQNNLKPKLDFLAQCGISGYTLIHTLTNSPEFLKRSLRCQIAPTIHFLNTFFNNNHHQTLNSFLLHNRATHMIRFFSENTPVNVESLRLHGVPDSSIVKLFLLGGGPAYLAQDPERFSKNLKDIMDMGFDLSSAMFPHVFRVYCGMSKDKWVSKMEVIKECFGLTRDEQVLALFVKQPSFMKLSVENLQTTLEFFMKRLGWTPEYMATYSNLLACSLERKILPRISVMEVLKSKGLVKDINRGNAFIISEDKFLSMFVNRYQKDIPEIKLMEIYTNSMQRI